MPERRNIRESRVLAAMSHPARRRLLDVLTAAGPAKVGSLAEHTGLAVGSVSHHLRVLFESGLVSEVPELARDGREHWWRAVAGSLRWSTEEMNGDPADAAVAMAADALNFDHQIGLVRQWTARRDEYGAQWRQAAFSTDSWLHLTPAELDALQEEITAVIHRWSHREPAADNTDERQPVFVFARGIPGMP